MSLYQKYRAKKFSEVLTQKHITDTLQAAIRNSSFGHAYVFVGTRGTGKTSIARIFARTLNCQHEHAIGNAEPCNDCESCKLSLQGGHIDIIEMDAASNRGIEEVRNLKESVDFLPSIGKYKIYIIDEAHMMTKEAFNALLKTIEEPPKHIVFIMCTTEIHKLPATILSRSQVFELKHATSDEIITKINIILEQEQKQIEDDGKKIIAKLGRGSFRDTESILEKVIQTESNEIITVEHVVQTLGLSSIVLIDKTKKLLYDRSLNELKNVIEHEIDEGSLMHFNIQLAEAVYDDISEGLQNNEVDHYKLDLFSFLTSVDKEMRGSLRPKYTYLAQVLRQVGNYNIAVNPAPVVVQQVAIKEIQPLPEPPLHNPSALLRHKKMQQAASAPVTPQATEITHKKFISKLDFLNYIQENNSFLYRFFSSHEFQLDGDIIRIDAQKQMEKDLVQKPQTIKIIKQFGDLHKIELKVEFAAVEKSSSDKTEKKLEDMGDDEIKQIFKVQ